MSSTTIKPEDLAKSGITTIEELNDLKKIASTKFFQSQKAKSKVKKVDGKTSENLKSLRTIVGGIDKSYASIVEIADAKEKSEKLASSIQTCRNDASAMLKETTMDYNRTLKLFKSLGVVLSSLEKPVPTPKSSSPKPSTTTS